MDDARGTILVLILPEHVVTSNGSLRDHGKAILAHTGEGTGGHLSLSCDFMKYNVDSIVPNKPEMIVLFNNICLQA